MTPFALSLRAALRAAKMSQAELARRCRVDRASVSGYLSGHHEPRAKVLARINEVLGADLRVADNYRVPEVAGALGISKGYMYKALQAGNFADMCEVVHLPGRKRRKYRYVFYPAVVRAKCGVG